MFVSEWKVGAPRAKYRALEWGAARAERERASGAYVAANMLVWYLFSISITLMNKHLFTNKDLKLPFLFTFIHMTVNTLLLRGVRVATERYENRRGYVAASPVGDLSEGETTGTIELAEGVASVAASAVEDGAPEGDTTGGPTPLWNVRTSSKVLVVVTSLFTALEVGLTNAAVCVCGVAATTVAKSGIVVTVYALSVPLGLRRFRARTLAICAGVVGGGLASLRGLPRAPGGPALLAAVLAVSTARWLCINLLLARHRALAPAALSATLHALAALCVLPLALVREPAPPALLRALPAVLAVGAAACVCVLAELRIVRKTGAVTLAVGGCGKELATLALSHLLFQEAFTRGAIISIGITLFFIVLYAVHER